MSQCAKSIRLGHSATFYCQAEDGHEGPHIMPPVSWGEIKAIGGKEGEDAFLRKVAARASRSRAAIAAAKGTP